MKQETIQEIKNTVDIVDVVEEFVDLKPSGQNLKGFCPVHAETEPSFTVSPEKQIAKCFGCGFSADAIGFLMEVENLGYIDALKFIANYYGISIEENKEYQKIYKANARLTKYFQKRLFQAPKLLKYLKSRRLSKQTVKEFKLGYAPKENYIQKLNISHAKEAGLTYDGNPRFYNRIMFPILNSKGKTIGFNSRRLPNRENGAKYLNIPNTKVYKKSKAIYNIYRAKRPIKEQGYAILVEGNMDVISLYNLGIKNVIGSCGTAITNTQIGKIKRYTDTIFLLLDSDEAGQKATLKAGFTGLKNNFYVHVIPLPEDTDPADYFKSKKMFEKYVSDNQQTFLNYFFDKKDISGLKSKTNVIDELKNQLKGANSVKEELIINEISDKLNVSKDTLRNELRSTKKQSKPSVTTNYRIEMTIAKESIQNKTFRKKVFSKTKPKMFKNKIARQILKILKKNPKNDIFLTLDNKIDRKHMQFLKRENQFSPKNCLQNVIKRYKDKKIRFLKKKLRKTDKKEQKDKILAKIIRIRQKN